MRSRSCQSLWRNGRRYWQSNGLVSNPDSTLRERYLVQPLEHLVPKNWYFCEFEYPALCRTTCSHALRRKGGVPGDQGAAARTAARSTAEHGRFTRTTTPIAAAASRQARTSLPSKTTNVFSGGAGQVGACQLAQFRSLVLKRLDQAGAFGSIQFWSSCGVSPADSQSSVAVMQSAY